MAKKKKALTVFLIILLSAILLTGVYSYSKGYVLFSFGEAPSCLNPGANDVACFCPVGMLKIYENNVNKFTCVNSPQLPSVSSITRPINSWEEAISYTESQVGSNAKCSGQYGYRNPVTGTIPTTSMVIVECTEYFSGQVVTGGRTLYSMYFNQNSGCINQRYCRDEDASTLGFTCNPDIDFTPNPTVCPLGT